jgi:hypothetical protein
MEELRVDATSEIVNQNLIESKIRPRFDIIVIGIKKADGDMVFNPQPQTVLEAGDTMILGQEGGSGPAAGHFVSAGGRRGVGNHPGIECVVARYDEDVAWTGALRCPVVVYDKSGAPGPLALPNIGRETHTYLSHIVRRYPDFPDHTVFLQADPFPHLPQGMDAAGLWGRIVQNARLGLPFAGLAWFKLKCDRLGRPHDMADPDRAGSWAGFGRDIPSARCTPLFFPVPCPRAF